MIGLFSTSLICSKQKNPCVVFPPSLRSAALGGPPEEGKDVDKVLWEKTGTFLRLRCPKQYFLRMCVLFLSRLAVRFRA